MYDYILGPKCPFFKVCVPISILWVLSCKQMRYCPIHIYILEIPRALRARFISSSPNASEPAPSPSRSVGGVSDSAELDDARVLASAHRRLPNSPSPV